MKQHLTILALTTIAMTSHWMVPVEASAQANNQRSAEPQQGFFPIADYLSLPVNGTSSFYHWRGNFR